MFKDERRRPSPLRGPLISILIFLLVFIIFTIGTNVFSGTSSQEGAERLETATRNAVIHCYSEEGAYPEDVKYLENHYGLTYDHDAYYIDYQTFASNVMPTIHVVQLGGTS